MSKISELSDGGSLVSSDYLIAVRSGGNVKVRMDQINVDQIDLGDNEFIRLGNSQDLTIVHDASNSIINQAGIGDLLIQKAGTTKASVTANGLEFPDSSKAIFGAGSDLQIYHSGSHSFISEAGTGDLYIGASNNIALMNAAFSENKLLATTDGALTLYHDGSAKLATTATGVDVTGTVTATKLVSANGVLELDDNGTHNGVINAPASLFINIDSDANNTGEDFVIGKDRTGTSGGTELFRVQEDGNVGIGTSSPFFTAAGRSSLSVNGTSSSILAFGKGGSSENYILADAGGLTIANTSATLPTAFFNNGSTRMTISSAGTVGIGMAPDANNVLSVKNTSGKVISLTNGVDADLYVDLTSGLTLVSPSTGTLAFGTSNTERMRLDSSGNLLVGKTANNITDTGVVVRSTGETFVTRSGAEPLSINRLSTDGDVLTIRKDSAVVGSIGSYSGVVSYLVLDPRANGAGLVGLTNEIAPANELGNPSDAAKDLGSSSRRFKDLYRSGSTFSTSDRTMKQDIRDLTDAERNVAVACKGLLKAFRFIDTVEKEGDAANIHFGIIAQDLAAAFAAEGLDANDYQVYKSIVTTDEDGNEQTRLNVCYENLLAFIIAAI